MIHNLYYGTCLLLIIDGVFKILKFYLKIKMDKIY